jgi:CubicO group peptidase (beta-lactamase class C family)
MKTFIALIFASVLSLAAQTTPDPATTIDKYLSTRAEMGNFSGSVLVAKGDTVFIAKGYGFANMQDQIRFTPDTRHSIASVSKMFTAMAALKAREGGKLKLEDSVCKFIDNCPDAWKLVTIQHLMRNTSGIPDYEEKLELASDKYLEYMKQPQSAERIVDDARKLPLDFVPGSKFKYSNTGFIVLSMAIEKATGRSFAEYVETELLRPAGMNDSGVYRESKRPDRHALGYTFKGTDWAKLLGGVAYKDAGLLETPWLSLGPPHGDAGMYSTVNDLLKWSLAMDGSKVVTASLANEVFTAGEGGYGYGWFVGKGFERDRYRHNGFLPGFASDFVKFPKEKITIVLFSNIDRTRMSNVMRDISSIVFGLPYDMPVRGKVVERNAAAMPRLEGEYKMADGTILTVKNEPDFLTASIPGRFTAGLIPFSQTEFYFPLADGRAIFTLDAEKKTAIKANLRYSGEDHIAERVKATP